jgi:hypothetical protein
MRPQAESAKGSDFGRGALAAVAPHGILALLILLAYANAVGGERRTSAVFALAEIFLFPAAVVLALARMPSKNTRR